MAATASAESSALELTANVVILDSRYCGNDEAAPRRACVLHTLAVADNLTSDLASLRIDRKERPARGPLGLGRVAVVVVVLAAVVGAGVVGYPRIEATIFKTEVTTGSVTLVSPVEASIKVTSTGYVVPQTASNVGAKVPGRVAVVHVKEGQQVEKDAVLVELEDADAKSATASAESRVATARALVGVAIANLEEIDIEVKREKKLVEKGASPAAKLENLEAKRRALAASVAAAHASVNSAMTEVETLRVGLDDRVIKAPIGGTIVNKPVEAGELVGAGAPVARIADFASMLVETDVPEGRLHQVSAGTPCEIVLDAYPTKRYRGEAVEIGKRVDRAKATVIVKVKFLDDMAGVLPDMSARVSFLSAALSKQASEQPAKLVVPKDAVVERDGAKVVFVLQDGIAKRVIVQVGEPVGEGLELVDGPSAGARVITNPPVTLRDGQAIKQKED